MVNGTNSLIEVLVRRDGLSHTEARWQVEEAKERVRAGEDPEEILHDEFGLEPDYLFDLLD